VEVGLRGAKLIQTGRASKSNERLREEWIRVAMNCETLDNERRALIANLRLDGENDEQKRAEGVKHEALLRELAKRDGHLTLFCTSAAWKGGIQKLNVSDYSVMDDGN
jgi:hypothetical protein